MSIIPAERIEKAILLLRGKKVMLDADLAVLYDVETRILVQAVKRNIDRFPRDFMFQLTQEEFDNLRSQSVTSSDWGGRRYTPFHFSFLSLPVKVYIRAPYATLPSWAFFPVFFPPRPLRAATAPAAVRHSLLFPIVIVKFLVLNRSKLQILSYVTCPPTVSKPFFSLAPQQRSTH